jgi:transaldolase
LLLQAASLPQYEHLFKQAVEYAKSKSTDAKEQVSICLDKLAVTFGAEILKIIPGRVSTEIDARLSFDTEATVAKAHQLAQMYRGMCF